MGIGGRGLSGCQSRKSSCSLQRSRRWGSAEGRPSARPADVARRASTEPPMGIGGRLRGVANEMGASLASTEPPMGIGGRFACSWAWAVGPAALQRSRRWGSAEGPSCSRLPIPDCSLQRSRRWGSAEGAGATSRRRPCQRRFNGAADGDRRKGTWWADRWHRARPTLQRSRRWGSAEGQAQVVRGGVLLSASTEPPMGIGGRGAGKWGRCAEVARLQRSRRWGSAEGGRGRDAPLAHREASTEPPMGIGGRIRARVMPSTPLPKLQRSRRWGSAEGGIRWRCSAGTRGRFNGAADGDRRKGRTRPRHGSRVSRASTEPPMGIGGRNLTKGLVGISISLLQRSRRWGSAEGMMARVQQMAAEAASTEPPMGIGGRMGGGQRSTLRTSRLQRSRRWGSAEGECGPR